MNRYRYWIGRTGECDKFTSRILLPLLAEMVGRLAQKKRFGGPGTSSYVDWKDGFPPMMDGAAPPTIAGNGDVGSGVKAFSDGKTVVFSPSPFRHGV